MTEPDDGATMRNATADSVAASADSRSATSDSRAATGHAIASRRHNDRSTVTLLIASLALIVAGGFGIWNQHQNNEHFTTFKECVNAYAKATNLALVARQAGSVELQAAQQLIFDDVAKLRNQPPPHATPAQLKAARAANEKFYIDLAAEQRASATLNAQRAAHPYPLPPEVACP